MKVLQVVPYFPPHEGGMPKYVYNLSKYLIKMGHDVHVITSNSPKMETYEEIEGITVERQRIIMEPLRNPITPRSFLINKVIKNFDVVHVHDQYYFSPMITAFLKSKKYKPLILTNHGKLKYDNPILDNIVKIYDLSVGKLVLNRCDIIVVNSSADKDYISKKNKSISKKIKIFPNSLDLEEYDKYIQSDISEFTQKYNISNKNIILFVGRIIAMKGIEYLIKAIPYVIKDNPMSNLIFMFVGSGDFFEKAKNLAKKLNVEKFTVFTGSIPFGEDLINAYKSARIFVLPSLSEGLPTVILEAMYFNLPVISTDIPSLTAHFKDTSLLVPPKDEMALAKAITELLNNNDLARKLSNQGNQLVRSKYLWKVTAKKYNDLYLDM